MNKDKALTTTAFWYKDNTRSFALGDRQITLHVYVDGETEWEFSVDEVLARVEEIKWTEARNKAEKFHGDSQ